MWPWVGSQAGWIAFNAVAVGMAVCIRRIRWLQEKPEEEPSRAHAENPTTPYLLPFLAMLAAGMIAGLASAGFEWLYPLRLVAAATVLWVYRSHYAKMDWTVGWFAPLVGIIAFVFWIALNHLTGAHGDNGIAAHLRVAPVSLAVAWTAVRMFSAVSAVPITEELVFRSFLIRRIISPDFLSLNPRWFTWFSVMLSSVTFGLLHGERWLAATLAGVLYSFAFLRRGRIGDAVAAHASTNAMLAGLVLLRGNWSIW
jgi:CAAX prenyl protease-like protein